MPKLLIKKIVGTKKHVKTQKGNEWDEWQVFGSVDGGEDDVYIVSFDPAGKENTEVSGYIQDRGQWGKKFNLPARAGGGGGGGLSGSRSDASIEAQKAVAEAVNLIVGNEGLSKKYIVPGDLKKTAAAVYVLATHLYKSIQAIKKISTNDVTGKSAQPSIPQLQEETLTPTGKTSPRPDQPDEPEQPDLLDLPDEPGEDESDQPDVPNHKNRGINIDDVPF